MRRLLRTLRGLLAWTLAVVLLAGGLLAAALGWLLGSEAGVRVLVEQGQRWVPGELTVTRVEGHLLNRLVVEGLHYANADMQVEMAALHLEWRPRELLSGRLHLVDLGASGVRYRRLTEPPAPAPTQGPLVLPDVRLPMAIAVDHLRVEDVEAITAPGAAPLRLTRLMLSAATAGETLQVASLLVELPGAHLAVEGRITPLGDYPLTLDTQWGVQAQGLAPLTGRGRIHGDLTRLELAQSLDGLARAELNASAEDPLNALTWQATLELAELRVQDLGEGLPGAALSGHIEAQGDLDRATAGARLAAREADPVYGPWDLALDAAAELAGPVVHVQALRVTRPDAPLSLSVAGDVEVTDLRFDLSGQWQALQWPPAGDVPQVASPRGELSLSGTPDDYRLALEAAVEGPQVPTGTWSLRADGDTRGARVQRLAGDTLGGRVTAQGRVAWSPALTWEAHLDGEGLDPGVQYPEWPGSLGLAVGSEGRLTDAGPQLSAVIERLEGELRGQPLAGQGRVGMAPDGIAVEGLHLASGQAVLEADGRLAERWDLTWRLAVPDLGQLLPEAAGRIQGSGALAGPAAAPRVTAALEVAEAGYRDLRLAALDLDAALDVGDTTASRVALTARDLALPGRSVQSAALTLAGHITDHTLELAVKSGEEALDLAAAGGYAKASGAWQGRLTALDVNSPLAGRWSLDTPAPVLASAKEATGEGLCLVREDARLCAEGRWSPAGGAAQARIEGLPLAWLGPLLPPGLAVTGSVDAQARATLGETPVAGLKAHIAPGEIDYEIADQGQVRVSHRGGDITADLGAERLTAALNLGLGEGGVQAQVQVPRAELERDPLAASLKGSLRADVREQGLVSAFVPAVQETRGRLTADLAVSGRLNDPQVSGQATLADAGASVPAAGIAIDDLRLTAAGDGGDTLRLDGRLRSGGGHLDVKGEVTLDAQRGWPVRLNMDGERFQVVDLPQAEARLSPALRIASEQPAGGRRRLEVRGTLTIPEADLRPKTLPPSATTASGDVVIVDENGDDDVQAKGPEVDAQVRLVLGDRVRFEGFGLKARFAGQLTVTDGPGGVPTGAGALRLEDGTYKAYGQDLTIERGVVRYAATPLDDPSLDVRATRTAADGTVAGVNVRGSARSPTLTLFSEPEMAETEKLAYLLTGRPLSGSSQDDANLLASAAVSMGLKGGEVLGERLRNAFGLEEVQIQRGATLEDTSVLVGKYLTPRLYVSYGFGLFESTERQVKMRYQLSDHWAVETSSGQEAGMDLLYTIEVE